MPELLQSPPQRGQIVRVEQVPIQWHSGLSIYASEPFLRSVGDEIGWLGGFDAQGNLRCVLPYTIVVKAILRLVRFRTETIPWEEGFGVIEEQHFLNLAMKFFQSKNADLVIPASTNTIFRTFPEGAIAAPYGSYVIDLEATEEELWAGVRSSHRRQIKAAQKGGVELQSECVDVAAVHELVRETFKRTNQPFMGRESFEAMVNGLGNRVRIVSASQKGRMQACAVFPYSEHVAYYVYGGTVEKPCKGSMHLLHWESMKWFRANGVRSYDFVGTRIDPEAGSKQEGLKIFKERFGGELKSGYMWKYPFKGAKYRLYGLASQLRSGGDIVDLERHKMPS